jgi:hypothetical protein
LTDASARDYEATPWIRDFIVSAEKKLNCATPHSTLLSIETSMEAKLFLLEIEIEGTVGIRVPASPPGDQS